MRLPEGVVTFLFSDVEGSTSLLERHPALMGAALARHHELFESIAEAHRGSVFETVGDAVYIAFSDSADAIAAALAVQLALADEPWGEIGRITCRIAIHAGPVDRRGDHYFGPALFRCARLQAIGHGEQVLISRAVAAEVGDVLPVGAALRDMGEHRLKDLADPELVFMLEHPRLRASFPPLKSLSLHPNNLPVQLSSLIGREELVSQISALLETERLVVLTGPGGIGKTRLALAVAAEQVERQPHGTFFVDLVTVRDGGDIPEAIAEVLGVAPGPDGDVLAAVARLLSDRPMLLVLDNLEQIPNAAEPVAALLQAAPELRLLLTSRTPLRVRGERVIPVPTLPARGLGEADLGPGGTLFVARAESAGGFALTDEEVAVVVRVVELLDGLPLAVELAAARTTLFDPAELLRRLNRRLDLLAGGARDAPARQRALRSTIDWSHALLGEEEQRAFAALGIFVGGCSVEAAEAVAATDADTLGRLVDASLIVRSGDRLRMLETIREYADEALTASGRREELAWRHAHWYRDWIIRVAISRGGDVDHSRIPEHLVDAERENIAAAIETFLESGDGDSVIQMARRLAIYWISHGQVVRGEAWLERAIDLAGLADDEETAVILAIFGEFPRFRGDTAKAIPIKERSSEICRRLGADGTLAGNLHDLADLWADLGDLDRARASGEEALRIRERHGGMPGMVHAIEGLADVELRIGDAGLARDGYQRALVMEEEQRTAFGPDAELATDDDLAYTRLGLAMSEILLGNRGRASDHLSQAVIIARRSEDGMMRGLALETAAVFIAGEDAGTAATLLGAGEGHRRAYGLRAWGGPWLGEAMTAVRSALGATEFEQRLAAGRHLPARDALDLAVNAIPTPAEARGRI